jgi:hypothetical protein
MGRRGTERRGEGSEGNGRKGVGRKENKTGLDNIDNLTVRYLVLSVVHHNSGHCHHCKHDTVPARDHGIWFWFLGCDVCISTSCLLLLLFHIFITSTLT